MTEIKDYMIEGKPTSEYQINWKCPVCGESYDMFKHPITVFKLDKAETMNGIVPKDYAVEVHCLCGYHYWYHHEYNDDFEDCSILASCENCHHGEEKFEGSYKCNTEAMKGVGIEDSGLKPQCSQGKYYSIGDEIK